jgi:glycosyltransferase involved in cell wall biosynthesis
MNHSEFRSMSISVVIRTKNSSQTIAQCLESVVNQSFSIHEIIVVDSGSNDDTLSIAEQYHCKIIHYPTDVEFNYSTALNLGIAQATGDHILILSSHVLMKYSNTIELMMSALNTWNSVCAVSMVRDSVQSIGHTPTVEQTKWAIVNRDNFKGQGMYNFCSLIRKSDWMQYPFNEQMPRCEDQDWVLHFYKQCNTGSLIIRYPTVYYSNPYYNATKDAWDYITLGHHIDRYFISKKFVFQILDNAVKELGTLNFKKFAYHLTVAYYLVRDRWQGSTVIRSVYNTYLDSSRH